MQRLERLEDVTANGTKFVDVYVSTDEAEVADVLQGIGFYEARDEKRPSGSLLDAYEYKPNSMTSSWKHQRSGLMLECADIPIEEALQMRRETGFMSMSKFRVHTGGNGASGTHLVELLKALNEERQNLAFVDDRYGMAFVKLSEFYC